MVPGAERLVETKGDSELFVLLCQRNHVDGVLVAVVKDIRRVHIPILLSERRVLEARQVLEHSMRTVLMAMSAKMTMIMTMHR